MSLVLYRSMLAKVKALLLVESSHSAEERGAQQWQLLFAIDGVQYVIGKGGVNTMFHQIGKDERVLLYPEQLLTLLEGFTKNKYQSFGIQGPKGKIVRHYLDESAAKKCKAPVGYKLIGMTDGKQVTLYKRAKGVMKDTWLPILK